ncbi:MAG: alpha/beta fold hydrolase [Pseudomonadota bacterium]
MNILTSCSALVILALQPTTSNATTTPIAFKANDTELSGLLDVPASGEAYAIVIIVHGYGKTNVVEQNWYFDLRSRLLAQGIATFVWDKPGCGESSGEFDPNQSVASSAREVLAAASFLRDQQIAGSQKIGLWGISRAGWIAPLAMAEDRDIEFWISVSGVDAKESFGYLLRSNWKLEGYGKEQIEHLYGQWLRGNHIVANGGTYSEYLDATAALRADPFFVYMSGGDSSVSEAQFDRLVTETRDLSQPNDPDTGLAIYVEDFSSILSNIDASVLALFGARDSIVNWRSTKRLYEDTIGRNSSASLKIVTFSDGNHNLHRSETGSFKEMMKILDSPEMVRGYYDEITTWLNEVVFRDEAERTDEPVD